jgi:hypothetical protein
LPTRAEWYVIHLQESIYVVKHDSGWMLKVENKNKNVKIKILKSCNEIKIA